MLTRLTPVLLAAALSWSSHAFAQCTKDSDCKGDRICQQGACVAPGGTATPPAPPPSRSYEAAPAPGPAMELGARRVAIKVHPLSLLGGLLLGAGNGITFLVVPVELEYALIPNVSVFGQLVPVVAAGPGGFFPGIVAGAGARFYPFGSALQGLWLGGMLAAGGGAGGTVPGFDFQVQGGWAWVFDSGFYISAGASLSVAGLLAGSIPVGLLVPIGFAF